MKKASCIAVVVLVGLLAQGYAQEKKAESKPAPGPTDALLEQWNDIGRKLIAMAEDFPEDKYDYKPAASMKSFSERMIHAAAANYFFTNLAKGEKPPSEEDPARAKFPNKAAIVAYVKKSFEDGAGAIKAKGDQGLMESVQDPFGPDQIRLISFGFGMVEHSGEIYGQLTVYYRTAGMVPPESRPKK